MELPVPLAEIGMERASSDEVGPGNRPDFFCAKTANGGQALCLPSPKGRNFPVPSKPFFSNQILLAYVVGIGSLLC